MATWQGSLSPSLPRIVATLWFHRLSHPVIFTCTRARLRVWNRSTQVGSIEAGAVADCVLYDLDAFSLLPHADPIVSLVLSSARPTVGTYLLKQNEPSLHFVALYLYSSVPRTIIKTISIHYICTISLWKN